MNEGQITGQRVEIRTVHPIYGHFGEFRPDTTDRGTVVAYLARGAVVQTDDGHITLADYSRLAIDGSSAAAAGAEDQRKRFKEWSESHECGPLCRTHGDPRDTNMAEPVAVGGAQ